MDFNLARKLVTKHNLNKNEGNTQIITVKLGALAILKLENQNPTGSFKDRSIPVLLAIYLDKGISKFVISSSGNSAISCATYLQNKDASLTIFVSNNISSQKFSKLQSFKSEKINIIATKRPKSDAIKYSRQNNALNIRGSEDDNALIGYESIAYELIEQVPNIDALFLPVSSGTGLVGISNGFKKANKVLAYHACQSSKINTISKVFYKSYSSSKESLADAIVDRVGKRKLQVLNIIKSSNGFGWIVNDNELKEAENIIKKETSLSFSYNSLLSVAGFFKSQKNGFYYKNPVLIMSGN